MQPLQFAAAIAISYLGIVAGFFLAYFTRDEMEEARKHFPILQRLPLIAAAAFALSFYGISGWWKIAAYIAAMAFLAFWMRLSAAYAALGILAGALAGNQGIFLAVCTLTFLFGLLSGSAQFARKPAARKRLLPSSAKLAAANSVYLAAAVITYLIFA